MSLTVLLVDDEPNILRNLESIIPWEAMGIEVIGLAKNGQKALDIAKELMPDIIFSDIRMPMMDGITFLEHLREFNKSAEVMVITGYQDFEYARSLLKYDVYDYILKPINYEKLIKLTEKIALKIRGEKYEQVMQKQKWSKVVTLAYEKIFYDIIMDYTTVNTKYQLSEEELNLEDFSYVFLLINSDNYSQKSLSWNENERKQWNFAIRKVLQDALAENDLKFVVLEMLEGQWCAVIEQDKQKFELDLTETKKWTENMQNKVHTNVDLKVSIGIYSYPVLVTHLPQVYKEMQHMMQLSPNKEEALLIYNPIENQYESVWNLIEMMVSGLKQFDKQMTESAFDKLITLLFAISEQSFIRTEQILYFLILHLLREMREIHRITIQEEENIWKKLDQIIGAQSFISHIHEIIENSFHSVHKKKNSELLMHSAQDYIYRNLGSDFGIEEICQYLGISSSYFSLLFKQHYRETFLEYLSKQRIEMAKSMLLLSDKSVTQIGKSVGFFERRYFTTVFQKYTGETPSEYRDKRKQ
jgi:two-component system response regulator YesN